MLSLQRTWGGGLLTKRPNFQSEQLVPKFKKPCFDYGNYNRDGKYIRDGNYNCDNNFNWINYGNKITCDPYVPPQNREAISRVGRFSMSHVEDML